TIALESITTRMLRLTCLPLAQLAAAGSSSSDSTTPWSYGMILSQNMLDWSDSRLRNLSDSGTKQVLTANRRVLIQFGHFQSLNEWLLTQKL
ncbi:MAG: hypothetical protein KDH86_13420, partial [Anaerolineae bacterium]|nr:hypothetical protein [Anaerolineae bacterium]